MNTCFNISNNKSIIFILCVTFVLSFMFVITRNNNNDESLALVVVVVDVSLSSVRG